MRHDSRRRTRHRRPQRAGRRDDPRPQARRSLERERTGRPEHRVQRQPWRCADALPAGRAPSAQLTAPNAAAVLAYGSLGHYLEIGHFRFVGYGLEIGPERVISDQPVHRQPRPDQARDSGRDHFERQGRRVDARYR